MLAVQDIQHCTYGEDHGGYTYQYTPGRHIEGYTTLPTHPRVYTGLSNLPP